MMEEYTVKHIQNPDSYEDFSSYVFGIDVGGTNTTIGVSGVKDNIPVLLFYLRYKSQEIQSLNNALQTSLSYAKESFDIDLHFGCIGAAGVVSRDHDFVQLTNASWSIDCKQLLKETDISDVFVINDFQIIGYGINVIHTSNGNDVITIKPSKRPRNDRETMVVIGAGTGLGKSILVYDKEHMLYNPLSSEGGHTDLPIYDRGEYELVEFIQNKYEQSYPVTYEQVLSGPGLLHIYEFFSMRSNNLHCPPDISSPSDISKHRETDDCCRKTFDLFIKIYARAIKNYILDTMATGGAYIAGGIAIKNQDLFHSDLFKKEVEQSFQREHLLQQVPIYIINNYDVSLLGACFAAINRKKITLW